jgi:hypothetical protein
MYLDRSQFLGFRVLLTPEEQVMAIAHMTARGEWIARIETRTKPRRTSLVQ